MTVDEKTISGSKIVESKFLRIFMILLSVLLIFVGPTYIPYVMSNLLSLDLVISSIAGFALFLVGIVLLIYLARKKVIT